MGKLAWIGLGCLVLGCGGGDFDAGARVASAGAGGLVGEAGAAGSPAAGSPNAGAGGSGGIGECEPATRPRSCEPPDCGDSAVLCASPNTWFCIPRRGCVTFESEHSCCIVDTTAGPVCNHVWTDAIAGEDCCAAVCAAAGVGS